MTVFYCTQNLCKLFTSLFFWQCTMGQIICKFKEVFIKHTTLAFNSFPYRAFNQESDVLNILIKISGIYRYVKAQTTKLCVNNTWPVQLETPSTLCYLLGTFRPYIIETTPNYLDNDYCKFNAYKRTVIQLALFANA